MVLAVDQFPRSSVLCGRSLVVIMLLKSRGKVGCAAGIKLAAGFTADDVSGKHRSAAHSRHVVIAKDGEP